MNGKKNEGKRNSYNPGLALIGENIRKRREALGMSQTELANRIGTSRASISEYENGEREMGLSKLVAISRELGCQPGELVDKSQVAGSVDTRMNSVMERLSRLPEKELLKVIGVMEYVLAGAESKFNSQ